MDLDDAVLLLQAADRWGILALRESAIERIAMWDDRGALKPMRKLVLATNFAIASWYEDAVRAVLRRPQLALSSEDLKFLKGDTLQALLEWRHQLDIRRVAVALEYPDYPPSKFCVTNNSCVEAMMTCWKTIIDMQDWPLSDFVEGLGFRMMCAGVCSHCTPDWQRKIEQKVQRDGEERLIKVAAAQMFNHVFRR